MLSIMLEHSSFTWDNHTLSMQSMLISFLLNNLQKIVLKYLLNKHVRVSVKRSASIASV